MEQKEMDTLLEKVGEEATSKVKAAFADRDSKIAELETKAAKVETLESAMREQGALISEMKNAGQKGQRKTFQQSLKDQLTARVEDFKSLKDTRKEGITIKAAGTMTTANIVPAVSTAAPYSITEMEGGITQIVRRQPYLRQIMNVRPISTMYAAWAEKQNPDGTAGATGEGLIKNLTDFDIVEATKKVEKITAYIKTSKENLADVESLQNEIETELMTTVELAFDTALWSGNGTSPILKGINTYAPAFDVTATPFALGIVLPNQFDVLRTAAAIIASNNFVANYALINPQDAAMMDMIKVSTTNGAYVLPPFTTADGRTIAGLTVIENNGVPVGGFLVGDFTKSNLRIREEMNISIGYENDDFTKNLVTILAELRAVHYVKTNHLKAFTKGTFATAITAITKP